MGLAIPPSRVLHLKEGGKGTFLKPCKHSARSQDSIPFRPFEKYSFFKQVECANVVGQESLLPTHCHQFCCEFWGGKQPSKPKQEPGGSPFENLNPVINLGTCLLEVTLFLLLWIGIWVCVGSLWNSAKCLIVSLTVITEAAALSPVGVTEPP